MRLSFVVMAYNQERYIADAVAAAFAQDHPDLEIVLTDDCSSDGTFAIMQDMAAAYTGPHRIILNRNTPNLGLIGHVNHLFSLATSDYLIYAAGDDISEPHRASRIAEVIARDQPLLIHSNVTDMDEAGLPFEKQRERTRHEILEAKSLPELARAMSHALGASCAWHRDLYERFGPITETGLYEDQVFLFRARLIGSASYIDERLVRYRRGIGISFGSKNDTLKKLNIDISILRQRTLDCLKVAPDRGDILKSLRKKLDKRLAERDALTTGASPAP
ncbi:MAG: glycosyltransferase [Tabrizicola sp.]|uniref:glycosyltransferase n=1 Tax=Tabrizicola sp. TaxID=2005166 RepID=UPI0027356BC4|nr:glycosyltransferase [Tabrizicola sp.]MDP3263747.1 glycosyltransferase [Tabrizicola sp.]MDP3647111.1 glycosyltransferase [Paracoccaceae bacterium]MDZ4066745.1 glycosyltransferase [Tabrizicola sp.]